MEKIERIDESHPSKRKECVLNNSMYLHIGETEEREPYFGDKRACYYTCLAYFASKYGWDCSPRKFSNDYYNGNMDPNDGWEGTYDKTEKWEGPNVGSFIDGQWVPNPTAYDYMSNYFETEGSAWSRGAEVEGLLSNGSGYVMGVIDMKNESNNKHAVILQSYSDGTYSYYDPQRGQHGTCAAFELIYAGKVTGLKSK